MNKKIPWIQDFINNVVWYVVFNVLNVWIGRPMFTDGAMSVFRTVLFFLSGFMFLGSWISVTRLLSVKKGWFLALLITIPVSLIVNFFVIQLF